MPPFTCDKGDVLRLNVTFKTLDDLVQDPGVVKVKVKNPSGTVYTKTFPTEITRTGVGIYYHDVDVTEVGTWYYRWEGTGIGQAAAERAFNARPSFFE